LSLNLNHFPKFHFVKKFSSEDARKKAEEKEQERLRKEKEAEEARKRAEEKEQERLRKEKEAEEARRRFLSSRHVI